MHEDLLGKKSAIKLHSSGVQCFFVGSVVKTCQNAENRPKLSFGTRVWLKSCSMVGQLSWEKINFVRDLNQSNIWRLCFEELVPECEVIVFTPVRRFDNKAASNIIDLVNKKSHGLGLTSLKIIILVVAILGEGDFISTIEVIKN